MKINEISFRKEIVGPNGIIDRLLAAIRINHSHHNYNESIVPNAAAADDAHSANCPTNGASPRDFPVAWGKILAEVADRSRLLLKY